MNASEMTNKQIAEELLDTIPRLGDEAQACTDADDILREAAKRLLTDGDDDISKDAEIVELRECLKEAEALFIEQGYADRHGIIEKWRKALEGGTK